MNFLAHIYLSGDNPRVMVGNFIGDFVKGRNLLQQFDEEVAFGIELHRSIDQYTDHHPVVKQSKTRLWPTYRHYAAVLVDVFYDHFLSRYWDDFSAARLADFATGTYGTLKSFEFILPENVRQLLPYMIRQNWLVNYGNFDGLQQTLNGMSRRTTHDSKMDQSLADLEKDYDAFKQEFEQFFPELIQHCNAIITQSQKNPIPYPNFK
jgi:acyl carrier protein phosphodiesterase